MSTIDDDDEAMRIEDDDGGVESDGDICERCDCPRDHHEEGKGPCSCGRCRKFVEVA
jgi:hypothetical protein